MSYLLSTRWTWRLGFISHFRWRFLFLLLFLKMIWRYSYWLWSLRTKIRLRERIWLLRIHHLKLVKYLSKQLFWLLLLLVDGCHSIRFNWFFLILGYFDLQFLKFFRGFLISMCHENRFWGFKDIPLYLYWWQIPNTITWFFTCCDETRLADWVIILFLMFNKILIDNDRAIFICKIAADVECF